MLVNLSAALSLSLSLSQSLYPAESASMPSVSVSLYAACCRMKNDALPYTCGVLLNAAGGLVRCMACTRFGPINP
jgi:hypothetical protein